jgi:hypothetical protein
MAFHPFHPRKPLKTATSYLATGYHYPFSHCTICTFNRGTTYPSYNLSAFDGRNMLGWLDNASATAITMVVEGNRR